MDTEVNIDSPLHKSTEQKYPPHKVRDNGSILNDVYLCDKILVIILSYISSKDLLKNCLYICHKWKELIQHEVWKLKTERKYFYKLIRSKPYKRLPDLVYQGICCKGGYNRNLLRNNSGRSKLKHWKVLGNGDNCDWKFERPDLTVTRPKNATYEEPRWCFITSRWECKKKQIINLKSRGIHPIIMDEYQPDIVVSEWYAAKDGCPSYYKLQVYLLNEDHCVVDKFQKEIIMKDKPFFNGWQVISHTFRNYGPGVRYVSFVHTGYDLILMCWYERDNNEGPRMTNARVIVDISNLRNEPICSLPRYLPHEVPNNGSILNEAYLPDNILVQILSYVHSDDLLKNCLYVCHKWEELIQHEVWKLKTERKYFYKLIRSKPYKRLPDLVYQGICCNVGYNCNLLHNNSGQLGFEGWKIPEYCNLEECEWNIENPVEGLVITGREVPQICFVTSGGECTKRQLINLTEKGVDPKILDEIQPEIFVSEWFTIWPPCCTFYYKLEVCLLDKRKKEMHRYVREFRTQDELDNIHDWQKVVHTFENYGPGVRYIAFTHTACESDYFGRNYGPKIASGQVIIKF